MIQERIAENKQRILAVGRLMSITDKTQNYLQGFGKVDPKEITEAQSKARELSKNLQAERKALKTIRAALSAELEKEHGQPNGTGRPGLDEH